uniref:LysR family transcriptional regulator n=1 Tax=Romanomermis culicivorax TaxID=13658 RepID=A0A915HZB2_ROMCU
LEAILELGLGTILRPELGTILEPGLGATLEPRPEMINLILIDRSNGGLPKNVIPDFLGSFLIELCRLEV